MNLSTLKPAPGSRKNKLRKGRGPGSHLGKTSGRGVKGAGSRKSSGIPAGFEGGQMPLQRRLPKRGFRSKSPKIFQIVNLAALERKCEGVVTKDALQAMGLIKNADRPVKILGKGKLTKILTVKADSFSDSARKAIEALQGVAEVS